MRLITTLLLFSLLSLTTYAYFSNELKLNNIFKSATVKISINDKQNKLFDETVLNLSPGVKQSKPLTIKNLGTVEVYYKFYLDHVNGELDDVILFNIYFEDSLVYSVHPSMFNENNALVSKNPLKVGESHTYTIEVECMDVTDETYQSKNLKFDIVAIAVQAKNNPDILFE
ncbi:MAG: hypothetical protein K0Q49_931 [Haloplasmataceae bacterium]|jgi:hypothetical protein|nr:hypothetical protein [Haloplasmataceae bacterium]